MRNKNIWIWNHYGTEMYENQGGRHYWFAENLLKKGFKVTIFCASTFHNSNAVIDLGNKKYITKEVNGIKFVFIQTSKYNGNGKDRILNMLSFYRNLPPVSREIIADNEKPDIILSSSVHPMTLVAGIKVSKRYRIPCICEIRDLWPESIVAYGIANKKNPLIKLLYSLEKWIYKRADSIIMSWEGGAEYIRDKGWDNVIDLSKVYYLSNGVVLQSFDENSERHQLDDDDLVNQEVKNIIYTGSIRKVNNIGDLLDAAQIIQKLGRSDIQFLIYGDGDEKEGLMKRCKKEGLNNVKFKGKVEKKFIPYILKNAFVNVLHNTSTSLNKYGQSQNKFFEYLAAGKCIVQTYQTNFSICEKYECGLVVETQNPMNIATAIIEAVSDEEKNYRMGLNARKASCDFDFGFLTTKLIEIIQETEDIYAKKGRQ
ncbi:glycosyltransferase WbuB [Paenibacillus sp. 598K]|uniref:glycosyltransferase family 4 protein n=1 Tax=Paenibacillus sp. 598K TaxID=1117987 RepID=UPI000FFA1C60|nr:glycosyltransferase family 4 protein [Paenibacillus sp. 598K]GBF73572.1 glycosyltransferase WbuB [Paenibacillus sp. 598K]